MRYRTACAIPATIVFVILDGVAADGHAKIAAPCSVSSGEHGESAAELASIDRNIRALAPADDPQPLVVRLTGLTNGRCFALLDGFSIEPRSGLSLKTYWEDGGFEHLKSYLDLGTAGGHLLWFPPSIRRALTVETAPASPIAQILCPAADATCGVTETSGWVLRAEKSFELASEIRISADPDANCERLAKSQPVRARFETWRACEEAKRVGHAAFPIGRTRALKEGWLVIEGRRGHYEFCDEVRAYDLANGSAYIIASCGGLALRRDGSVDSRATDSARKLTAQFGHLPVDALREVAWMLLLRDELDHHVLPEGFGMQVPDGISIVGDPERTMLGHLASRISFTSGDTHLAWRVLSGEKTLKSGGLTWSPIRLGDASEEHAVTLLQVAEAGFVSGCPETLPPSFVMSKPARLSAHKLDTDRKSLTAAARGLTDGWELALQQQRTCSNKRLPAPGR